MVFYLAATVLVMILAICAGRARVRNNRRRQNLLMRRHVSTSLRHQEALFNDFLFSEVCLASTLRGISLWRKELVLPFPVSPPGKSRGGRVPPTPRTLPAGKPRRQASMRRLPPQEGFQSAPLKSPLRDPPVCHRTQTQQTMKRLARSATGAVQMLLVLSQFRWPVLK